MKAGCTCCVCFGGMPVLLLHLLSDRPETMLAEFAVVTAR